MGNRFILIFIAMLATRITTQAQSQADRILSDYSRINSVSCDIRKDTSTQEGEGRMLSRVIFEAPNRLLVENSAPFKRKILCDGRTFFYYADEGGTAIQQPFNEIREDLSIQAQSIPASPMEHLLRLKGLPETNIATTVQGSARFGYTASNLFAVISLDSSNRLAKIEFYNSSGMTNCYASTEYTMFEQPVPGVWLSLRHETEVTMQGKVKARESRRFSNVKVDQTLQPDTFKSERVFPKTTFSTLPK